MHASLDQIRPSTSCWYVVIICAVRFPPLVPDARKHDCKFITSPQGWVHIRSRNIYMTRKARSMRANILSNQLAHVVWITQKVCARKQPIPEQWKMCLQQVHDLTAAVYSMSLGSNSTTQMFTCHTTHIVKQNFFMYFSHIWNQNPSVASFNVKSKR
jgi:hypothetical protein